MTARSGYCPFCDASIPTPLLPLDYRNCKRCGAIVSEDDLVRRTNVLQYGGAGDSGNRIYVRSGGLTTTNATTGNSISSTITGLNAGDAVLFIVASHGMSALPSSVTGPVSSYTVVNSYHSNNQEQIVMYYGVATQSGSGTSTATWATNGKPATAYTVVITNADASPEATGNDNHNSLTLSVTSGAAPYSGYKVAVVASMCDADQANITAMDSGFTTLLLAAVNNQQATPNADLGVAYLFAKGGVTVSFSGTISGVSNVRHASVIGVFKQT